MTSERECYVYVVLPGETTFVTAGRFRYSASRDGSPLGAFVYGRSYLARPTAVELDPVELRLQAPSFETVRLGGFFGALRDAMPDHWGRRVIDRATGGRPHDDFDYLLNAADDRAGALGFGLNVEPPGPRRVFNRTLDLARLQQAADRLLHDEASADGDDTAQIEALLLLGTSMGGARPKAVVEDDDALWIAKFSRPDDRWNQPRVEHATMRLATRCGLSVADSRLETVGDRDILLVRRFDREAADGGYRRHRMVSALTVLQAEERAGHDRGRWSYLLFADELRRSSASPEADLVELYRRLCFNAAISNLDDHPRNHALLARGTTWRLSPAYDLTPTPQVARDHRTLALTCGRWGPWANRENILSGHGHFLLSATDAAALFDDIAGLVRAEWHPTMRRAGVSEPDCARIASAFVYDGLFHDPRAR